MGRAAGPAPARTALLAGASGLVGHALLATLRAEPRYGRLYLLLRRPVPGLGADARTAIHRVDFDRLDAAALPPLDDAFIALGTTIKVAGSEAAFRKVDFDAVVAAARAARAAGAVRLAVVSALGADARSRVFYNRVKGEAEDALASIGFETLVIAQPSLLLGDRAALGQPTRGLEKAAATLLRPLLGVVPKGVRPIEAADVAASMVAALRDGPPGVRRLRSSEMQGAADGR